jgi:predicted nucleic acid-binding protein
MTLVIDASIVCKWFFDEPGSDIARRLLVEGIALLAPDLIVAEVANVAWKRVVRLDISLDQASLAVSGVKTLNELVALSGLADRAFAIAAELKYPAYDCFYLALAEEREIEFVTDDRRLQRAAVGSRWEHWVRALR